MTIWFTADTHFGHENIIKYCNRPYSCAEEMDEDLIKAWNNNVEPRDTVYVLGDFMFKGKRSCESYLDSLRGRKILVVGNHDPAEVRACARWCGVHDYMVQRWNGQRVVLFHYPIEDWQFRLKGALHLHGHSHGNASILSNRMDVGVDPQGGVPISLDEIEKTGRP